MPAERDTPNQARAAATAEGEAADRDGNANLKPGTNGKRRAGGKGATTTRRGRGKGSKSPTPTPTPPDGGWGWMVVLSSFMISVFVDGVCFSIGIFFTPFREYYGTSRAETAWVGSVLNGTYLSIGPIVGSLVNRYGCRKITMLGSVIAGTAFFASTFSPSMPLLTALYGFGGGVGFGFVYLPAIVMVGYYFEKRRALATGIACCGSGIGAFVFAPLCNILLETYGWKGATWIMSAIVLNGLVFGVFYRPLEFTDDSESDSDSDSKEDDAVENGEAAPEQLQSLLKAAAEEEEGNTKGKIKVRPATGTANPMSKKSLGAKDVGSGDLSSLIQVVDADGKKVFPPRIKIPEICIEVAAPAAEDEHVVTVQEGDNGPVDGWEMVDMKEEGDDKEKVGEEGVKLRDSLTKNCKSGRPLSDIICTVTPTFTPMDTHESKTFRSDMLLKNPTNPLARLAYSQDGIALQRVNKPESHGSHHHHHHHHNHPHVDVNSPLQRKDIFYSGSLRNIPEFQSSDSLHAYRRKVTEVEEMKEEEEEEEEEEGGEGVVGKRSYFKRFVCDPLLEVFDISLLRSPTFVIYGLACFLCMLGFFVPFIYLPTLCTDLGVGASEAAYLISIIGMANTIGRVAVGFVSDQSWADCLLINNVALMIGGATTCCVPFFSDYPVFAVYAYIFGTSIAVFVSLRSIIMVELMGLQKLTNAFGLVIMFQGISTFIGAPIAGMLSDLTGDYNISFYVAGMFLALSGVICIPLRRIARWETARTQERSGGDPARAEEGGEGEKEVKVEVVMEVERKLLDHHSPTKKE
ncbi:monocarboxylate transporter 5-like [Babylonia areolata]|uniref:monocarboxylate transporter 5-like n=1 Tax=Babylonia areolata TaxID=304850 RepID=UPI003FD1D938